MSEPTLTDIAELLQGLTSRLDVIESRLDALEATSEIPEDVILAISAAVSAYLGHKAKVKAIHFARPGAWTQQGRQIVQNRAVSHVR